MRIFVFSSLYKKIKMSRTVRDNSKLEKVTPLSKREMQIITLLADGNSKSKISEHLRIATSTVSSHVRSIFRKLGVSNAPGAVGKAFRCGILTLD